MSTFSHPHTTGYAVLAFYLGLAFLCIQAIA